MKFSGLLTVIFFLLTSHILSAHEMWIETKPMGSVGVTQEVKVFFGEFSWNKPTSAAKWFSDIADCKLILTTPDGTTKILEKSKEEDCYKASFIPKEKGIYKLSFVHVVKDVYKEMRLTYVSAAVVNVSASKKGSTIVGQGHYQLKINNDDLTKGYPTHFTVMEEGKIYAKNMVEVSNLDSTTNNLTTDAKGMLTFPDEWKGGQLIQLAFPVKIEGQKEHNGKPYTNDYTVFTFYTKS
ncbi:DUF4198 domain-containing protein [Taibaiella lutea]|uniref:DUF4198 domain-containing protein n=1 Tax=Taibaiella lutea TaxID=2608001 RepID=A0A5M6CR92_9BACT|nr:DUF4198 domain-containing protein [Taibaiella lutea]KAA5537483.1 DUF4198 domain-containing protein [Taibaiella lutea]